MDPGAKPNDGPPAWRGERRAGSDGRKDQRPPDHPSRLAGGENYRPRLYHRQSIPQRTCQGRKKEIATPSRLPGMGEYEPPGHKHHGKPTSRPRGVRDLSLVLGIASTTMGCSDKQKPGPPNPQQGDPGRWVCMYIDGKRGGGFRREYPPASDNEVDWRAYSAHVYINIYIY